MKIVITGANGFLGSNLVRYFLSVGDEILAFSRETDKIADILPAIQFESFADKFTEEHSRVIREFKPDAVIHLAWAGANSYTDINNISQLHKNIPMSIQLLEILNTLEVKPAFIGTGTIFEYGLLTSLVDENSVENPVNFYGLIKNSFNRISKMYCEQNQIPWTWIRICYVYGPDDADVRFIPTFIKRLLSEEQEPITFDSCETRIDYLYISDFCKAIDSIIKTQLTGVYNISSGKQYVMREIISLIKQTVETSREVYFDPTLDINRRYASKFLCSKNDKLRQDANWSDLVSLEQGIAKTVKFYKNIYERKNNN